MNAWEKNPKAAWTSGLRALARRVDKLAASQMKYDDAIREFMRISDAGYKLYEKSREWIDGGAAERSDEWDAIRRRGPEAAEQASRNYRAGLDKKLSDMKEDHRRVLASEDGFSRESRLGGVGFGPTNRGPLVMGRAGRGGR